MSKTPLLIADIGGTNARFAIATAQAPFFTETLTLQCADFSTIESAIDSYLKTKKINQISGVCFSVAGPVQKESVKFTNNSWHIKGAELASRYNIDNIKLLNDFSAISYSLPFLGENDILAIGGDWPSIQTNHYTYGIIGPGSGLGVGGLFRRDGSPIAVMSEGGHVGFAAENKFQQEVLSILHKKFERVSRERLLSGPGLVNLYEALCEINSIDNEGLSPADIAMQGTSNSNDVCTQTMSLFFEILGQVCGDIALSIGTYDGMFIGGGITQRYPQELLSSKFRSGFENKGRYRETMETIPTWLITHSNAGLLGASIYGQSL